MQPKPPETHDPVVLALIDAVTAWQGALEQALSSAGISYVKWLLLRAVAQGKFTRHQSWQGPILIDPQLSEHLLGELHLEGWIVFAHPEKPGDAELAICEPSVTSAAPRIAPPAKCRFDRLFQSVRALHSVSVAPFSAIERATLSALLRRMQNTLHDHTSRQTRLEPSAAAAA